MCKNDFKPVNNLFVEPQDLLICNGIKVLTLYMTSQRVTFSYYMKLKMFSNL